MNFRAKSIIKKVALILAGITAVTAAGFGVKALVDYTKDDLKTITPTFEVGNLGSDGKFVDDKSTLYTKEAFGCYGLQIKPDFDSTVNYQIFYYDILDNFVSSSEVLSNGFSEEAPLNGAYARLVINPREDEDGKIVLMERVQYPGQLTIKVKKEQDMNGRYGVLNGKLFQVESEIRKLVFTNGLALSPKLAWSNLSHSCVTSTTVLKVDGGSTLVFDNTTLGETYSGAGYGVYCFKDIPSSESFLDYKYIPSSTSYLFNSNVKYVILSVQMPTLDFVWEDSAVSKLPSCFSITKN